MLFLLTVRLKKIIYSGDNIGNDLCFQLSVKDQETHLKSKISHGQGKSFQQILFQEVFPEGSVSLPISVYITEEDPVFNDIGSGSSHFNVQLSEPAAQTHSFSVSVKASGGDKPKQATFTFLLEAIVEVLKVNILYPSPNENHTYVAQPDYNSTGPIVFKANVEGMTYTGNIHWQVKLEYQTDGGGPYEKAYQFTSPNNQQVNRTFTSEGGRLTINASAIIGGIRCSEQVINYITGVGIPNVAITERLRALYTPPPGGTVGLLTGIAMEESSYRQFFNTYSKYGLTARWPVENISTPPSRGTYIGMMQVPVAMDTAWDWRVNTQAGANIFARKLTIAAREVANLQVTRIGLPNLTGIQLENYALGLYGGFRADRYYTPVQVGGQWQWQTTTRQDLLDYVSLIRNNIQ